MNRGWLLGLMLFVGCSQQTVSSSKEPDTGKPASEQKNVSKATTDSAKPAILNIGSKAPPLKVSRFLKGKPVEKFEDGKVYVVEFWATWCGPCIQSMPHITELQKKYPAVTFIGVNIKEADQSAAERFLETKGDVIGYRIAQDIVPEGGTGDEGIMSTTWLDAAIVDGIPAAFVVNGKGVIANITHPMLLDESLPAILEGSWDLTAAADKRLEEVQGSLEERELQAKLGPLLQNGSTAEALAAVEELIKEYPRQAENLSLLRFDLLLRSADQADRALQEGRELLKGARGKSPQFCNELAWFLITPDRKTEVSEPLKKLALEAALQADKLAKQSHPLIADTLARAQFASGDAKSAAETQHRAIELAETSGADEDTIQELKERLKTYDPSESKKPEDDKPAPKSKDGDATNKSELPALPKLPE